MTMVGDGRFVLDPRVAIGASRGFDPNIPGDRDRLMVTALDLQSVGVREIAARLLDPDLDFSAVVERARVGHPGTGNRDRDLLWSHLAAIIGLHGARASDHDDALALFGEARRVSRVSEWNARVAYTYAQMLWAAGCYEALAADEELLSRLPGLSRRFLEVDLEGIRSGVGSEAWLAVLNSLLQEMGATPIALSERDGASSLFDHLASSGQPGVDSDALVTVIMAAFRPGAEVITAARSILDQTWQNLELLIVDDASGSDYAELFATLESMDRRVRVLTQPTNRGTYAARNRALEAAAGEFVTFQDDDDWSHPERLERQVLPLLNDPRLLRTLSRSVRCTDDLVFQHLGSRPFRSNASSHLFRRSLLEMVGRFDWVRKSADTELDRRLEAVLPGRRLQIREPLAFVRLQRDSLSRADFLPGWMHPARAEYRAAMLYWHDQIAVGASPYMPAEVEKRPLSAPRPYLTGLGVESRDVDVVYMADWTRAGSAERAAVGEIRALIAAGTRVGVLHVRSAASRAPALAPHAIAIRRLIADGSVTAVTLEEQCHVPAVVVRQPEVLEWPTSRPVSMVVDRVLIMADHVPRDDSASQFWTVSDCDHNAAALFGVKPRWWARLSSDSHEIAGVVGCSRVLTRSVPRVLDAAARREHGPGRRDRLAVGWIFDDAAALPSAAHIRAVFPDDGSVDVRLMGPRHIVKKALGEVPAQWLVYDEGELSAQTFWSQVDVAVGFPARTVGEDVLRPIYEGMAAGCRLVLDPAFGEAFGDRAIYSAPADLAALFRHVDVTDGDIPCEEAPAVGAGGAAEDLMTQGEGLRALILG